MFSFDSDKKKELEDNMEDIKDLINKDKGNQKASEEELEEMDQDLEEGDFADPAGFDDEEKVEKPEPSDFQNVSQSSSQAEQSANKHIESFEESPDQENQNNQSSTSQTETQQDQRQDVQDFSEDDFRTSNSEQKQDQQSGSRSRDSGSSRREALERDIPEPAKTKDINVPEIEKGPLFIRQKKFESAVSMIQEMRYLSREIEDVVNHLEQGIREDEKTEREARELLHSLDEDRSGVKDIISPQKKM